MDVSLIEYKHDSYFCRVFFPDGWTDFGVEDRDGKANPIGSPPIYLIWKDKSKVVDYVASQEDSERKIHDCALRYAERIVAGINKVDDKTKFREQSSPLKHR